MSLLAGQILLVTGAYGGIGAACASKLAELGAQLIISDIREPKGTFEALTPHRKGHLSVVADVSDVASVVALFEHIDRNAPMLTGLVHCAGVIHEKPLLETGIEEFDRVININLRGSFLVGKESIRRLEGREGRILLTSSDLGVSGRETFSPYVASKHGVMGLMRSWAKEFGPRIKVNALCPGPIDTDMLGVAHMSPEWRARELAIPAERFGKPEEIAAMAAFLMGPDADFITGQGIGINGGSVMP
ncbi:MAG: SDR family oxidoreductase [Sulfitobacter sp.]